MKYGAVLSFRYNRVGNQYYTSSSYHADMWRECLQVFDEVIVAARVVHAEQVGAGEKPTLADSVKFAEFPNTCGAWTVLKALPQMFLQSRKVARQADFWMLRSTNFLSFCMWFWVRFYGIPYAIELTGDQSVNLAYLKLRGVKFARVVCWFMRFVLHLQLTNPVAVIGVSKSLPKKFPPRNNCPTFAISDNRIPESLFGQPRQWEEGSACRTIVCLGRCEAQKDVLGTMRVLARLDGKGFTNWKFIWIGSGPLETKAQDLAEKLGISDKVNFLGFVPWDDVFEILDTADIFLLNSVSEGLPRALMEGMARALPAIGTDVGGVSELLSPEDIIPRLQVDMAAEKLYKVLGDPARLTEMSKRNLATSRNYSSEVLKARKLKFYENIKQLVSNCKKKNRR